MDEFKQFFDFLPNNKRVVPVYESRPDETISGHWNIALPVDIPLVSGQIDLYKILRSTEVHCQAEEIDLLNTFSQFLNKIRRQILENTMRQDIDLFYTYLLCIRKLTKFFENNSTLLPSYFADSTYKECGHFMYEYMNVILFLIIRIHQAMKHNNSLEPPVRIEQLATCKLLLMELKQCCLHCLQEKSNGSSKWVYTPPLESIASGNEKQLKQSKSRHLENERTTLKKYIEIDLCGVKTLDLRITLFNAMKNEVHVQLLQQSLSSIPLIEQHDKTHELIAPMIRNIIMDYDSITKDTAEDPGYISLFTQYKSYYWVIYSDYLLAKIDWQYFKAATCHDFLEYGKRAYKRLDIVLKFITKRALWLSQHIHLDETLSQQHGDLKSEIAALYKNVGSELCLTSIPDCHLPETRPLELPASKLNLNTIFTTKWQLITTNYGIVPQVFNILVRLSKTETTIIIPSPIPTVSTLTNAQKHEVINERERHLKWLLSMKDCETNTITINKAWTEYLSQEYLKLCAVINENKNF